MSRESCLLRGPLYYELFLFVAQLGRRVEEIVISERHRATAHDGCNRRGHRAPLLHIQSRPVRKIEDLARLVRTEQIRWRQFRIPGTAALVRMAIGARVREGLGDLRVCCETIRRSGSSLHRCRVAAIRTTSRQYGGANTGNETGCRQIVAPNSGGIESQPMHHNPSPKESIERATMDSVLCNVSSSRVSAVPNIEAAFDPNDRSSSYVTRRI